MADSCIFCGKTLSFFTRISLNCGGVDQLSCADCAEKYGKESMIQRARLALDTGRAREPEKLTAFLEGEEKRRQAQEQLRQEREKWREKACPVCGTEMELKLENFSIGADGGGGLMTLLADTYEVDLFACPVCGKVELYTARFFREEEPEPEEQVTCPVCGTRHSSSVGCPTCALLSARSGRRPQPAEAAQPETKPFKPSRSRPGQKPPWEK